MSFTYHLLTVGNHSLPTRSVTKRSAVLRHTCFSVLVILQMQPQAFQTVPSLYWQQTIAPVPSDSM